MSTVIEVESLSKKYIIGYSQKQSNLTFRDTIDQDCPGFLDNWSSGGLLPLQGPEEKRERCQVEIYKVY